MNTKSVCGVWNLKRQGRPRRPEISLECVLVCPYMLYVFLCVVWSLKLVDMNLTPRWPYLGSKSSGYESPKGPLGVLEEDPTLGQQAAQGGYKLCIDETSPRRGHG